MACLYAVSWSLFLLVSFVGGGKNKVRTHKVVGSLVLFVDVLNFIGVLFIMFIEFLLISVRYS